jgi:hypothetical protein
MVLIFPGSFSDPEKPPADYAPICSWLAQLVNEIVRRRRTNLPAKKIPAGVLRRRGFEFFP